VTSNMRYMIVIQDSRIMGTCFGNLKLLFHDGDISVALIDSRGVMQEIHSGLLVNGRLDLDQLDTGE
jgi:hypothetical protein